MKLANCHLLNFQYAHSQVRLNFTFESASVMAANGVDTTADPTATLYATFVYLDRYVDDKTHALNCHSLPEIRTRILPFANCRSLDTHAPINSSERKRFSQQSHEYLISVVQHTGAETIAPGTTSRTTNLRLNFNHPAKTLIWALKGEKHGKFTVGPRGTDNDRYAPLQSAKLQLNGHDRMDERTGLYYNAVQPFEHVRTKPAAGIYMYSFSLRPDEVIQQSGSVNLVRFYIPVHDTRTKRTTILTPNPLVFRSLVSITPRWCSPPKLDRSPTTTSPTCSTRPLPWPMSRVTSPTPLSSVRATMSSGMLKMTATRPGNSQTAAHSTLTQFS